MKRLLDPPQLTLTQRVHPYRRRGRVGGVLRNSTRSAMPDLATRMAQAERTRRFRARQRGEDAPKLKAGRKPQAVLAG
jgi:hypothetical protein